MADRMYTALVTGGSRGIGAATVQRFLELGYKVISVARNAGEIRHERLVTIECDLMDMQAVADLASTLRRDHDVSHVVHGAALIEPSSLEDVDSDTLAGLAQLHIATPVALMQAVAPAMKAGMFGRVVFIASIALLGRASRTAYAGTKIGMIGLARSWALELGPFGITVNVVAPGPTETETFHEIAARDGDDPAALAARVPVRRLGRIEDVTDALMFFSAPQTGFVTGQTLFVCGGLSVGRSPT